MALSLTSASTPCPVRHSSPGGLNILSDCWMLSKVHHLRDPDHAKQQLWPQTSHPQTDVLTKRPLFLLFPWLCCGGSHPLCEVYEPPADKMNAENKHGGLPPMASGAPSLEQDLHLPSMTPGHQSQHRPGTATGHPRHMS